ncbi:hypothetical protein ACA910_020986 [Epithemia clementina (nom. ined.)]
MSFNTDNLLPSSLQKSLQQVVQLCNQSSGEVRAITLSTMEGVPLGRVYGDLRVQHEASRVTADPTSSSSLPSPPLNEETLSLLETVWAPPSKQLPVLGLDKVQTITAIYDHGILVHLYWSPLVITVLCGPNSNLSAVKTTAVPLLRDVLSPLRITLIESLQLQEPDDVHQIPENSYYQS